MTSLQDILDRVNAALSKKNKQLSTYVLVGDIQAQRLIQETIDELNDVKRLIEQLSNTVKSQVWQR
jgi:hypothetical protein